MAIPYVKVARKAFESDTWWNAPRKFSAFEAWLDMIQLARWSDYTIATRGYGSVKLERGEFCLSLRQMAQRWGWSLKNARSFVGSETFRSRIVAQRKTQAGIVYRIVNYDTYQDTPGFQGTADGTERAQKGHRGGTRDNTSNTSNTSNPTTLVAPDGAGESCEPTTKPTAPRPDPSGFARCWKAYPRRAKSNPRMKAEKAYRARVRAGVDERYLYERTLAYQRWCAAKGMIGGDYVMMAATFYGPDCRYDDDFGGSGSVVDNLPLVKGAADAEHSRKLRAMGY